MTCYNCVRRALEDNSSKSYCVLHKKSIWPNSKCCDDWEDEKLFLPDNRKSHHMNCEYRLETQYIRDWLIKALHRDWEIIKYLGLDKMHLY